MHFLLVHEDGNGEPSVEIFADRKSSRTAFKGIDSGTVTLYELRRSQAVKRANFDIVHEEAKNSLDKMSDKQLRSAARKLDLSIADNPQATSANLISEIQQADLTNRLAHRRPLLPGGTTAVSSQTSPSGDANKPAEGAQDDYDNMTIDELKALDEDVDLTGCTAKQDYVDRHRAYNTLDESTVPELKDIAASEQVEVTASMRKSDLINAIIAKRRG